MFYKKTKVNSLIRLANEPQNTAPLEGEREREREKKREKRESDEPKAEEAGPHTEWKMQHAMRECFGLFRSRSSRICRACSTQPAPHYTGWLSGCFVTFFENRLLLRFLTTLASRKNVEREASVCSNYLFSLC